MALENIALLLPTLIDTISSILNISNNKARKIASQYITKFNDELAHLNTIKSKVDLIMSKLQEDYQGTNAFGNRASIIKSKLDDYGRKYQKVSQRMDNLSSTIDQLSRESDLAAQGNIFNPHPSNISEAIDKAIRVSKTNNV